MEAIGDPRALEAGLGTSGEGVCGLRQGTCGAAGGGAHLQVPVYNVFLVTVVHSRYYLEGREEKDSYWWPQSPPPLSDPMNLLTTETQGPRPPLGTRPRCWGLTLRFNHSGQCDRTRRDPHPHPDTQISSDFWTPSWQGPQTQDITTGPLRISPSGNIHIPAERHSAPMHPYTYTAPSGRLDGRGPTPWIKSLPPSDPPTP